MFNMALLTPRNFIVIGVFAIIAHIVAKPVYKAIDAKKDVE